MLKPSLKDFEYNLACMWNEHNCTVIWTFFGIAFAWDWNENWSFPVLWLKDDLPSSVVVQCATGEKWRNSSRKNEEAESKQKHCPVLDMTGDGSKIPCCKEQYCIESWNLGPSIKENCKWSNRRWQSDYRPVRNQWTKMDQNGQI